MNPSYRPCCDCHQMYQLPNHNASRSTRCPTCQARHKQEHVRELKREYVSRQAALLASEIERCEEKLTIYSVRCQPLGYAISAPGGL